MQKSEGVCHPGSDRFCPSGKSSTQEVNSVNDPLGDRGGPRSKQTGQPSYRVRNPGCQRFSPVKESFNNPRYVVDDPLCDFGSPATENVNDQRDEIPNLSHPHNELLKCLTKNRNVTKNIKNRSKKLVDQIVDKCAEILYRNDVGGDKVPRCIEKINGENCPNATLFVKAEQCSDSLKDIFQVSEFKTSIPATGNNGENFVEKIANLFNKV